jgi:hypothetical protein
MKIVTALMLGMMFSSLVFAQSPTEKVMSDFHSLSWLEGRWSRINIKRPGRTAYEVWKKPNDKEFTGIGITLQGTDTVFVEKLKIVIQGNEIHYVADVPENPELVHFKFTAQSPQGFTCENPNHDFPKKISYRLEGNTLNAQTSGDGKVQEFIFEKVK